ncbi:IS66 family transposase [Candidatus Contendibacter odensensis]|uniref:Transposase n=1 Tax=Candidatus Contendobacter odensis Run_B_J11 TaxID=1400861 RepID=A0A7U7GBM0_9GAMM|nr:IS66 family transposase [Candidatus Contendobacter odensis]CDH45421.1 transposase [Candidatus Contendobacter odensis Run_B_J11]
MTTESIQNEIQNLKTRLDELATELASALSRESHLKLIVAKYKHMLFGAKSEKRDVSSEQPWLFPLPKTEEASAAEQNATDIATHTRTTKRKFSDDDEAPEGTFPEHLPQREQIIDEKPDGVADADLELVTEKITERLGASPEEYYVIRIVRKVYKNKSTGKFHTPEAPDHVLGRRCKVSEMCIIMFVIKKFLWHLPLYRQQQQLRLQGINISRDSLTKWAIELGGLFLPIANAIATSIRGSPVVHMDETPMRVGKKDKDGKKKFGTGFFWPILAAGIGVSFIYRPSRCWSEVKTILKEFSGVLISDAYGAYEDYAEKAQLKWQLCWMHIRRDFIDAERSQPKLAKEALGYIQELYRIENSLRGESDEKRSVERLKQSQPVLDKFHTWLVSASGKPEVITDELLSKAVSYVLPRWEAACLFVGDGAIPIDNGKDERAIRPTKLGMKNWLHCASEEGADTAAVFYTLIGSALMHGIHPYYYLLDLTKRITDPKLTAMDLTPANWKMRFYEEAVPVHLRDVIKPGEPAVGGPKAMQEVNLP